MHLFQLVVWWNSYICTHTICYMYVYSAIFPLLIEQTMVGIISETILDWSSWIGNDLVRSDYSRFCKHIIKTLRSYLRKG